MNIEPTDMHGYIPTRASMCCPHCGEQWCNGGCRAQDAKYQRLLAYQIAGAFRRLRRCKSRAFRLMWAKEFHRLVRERLELARGYRRAA